MNAGKIFQVVTELMTQNAAKESSGFLCSSKGIDPVEGALEHRNLANPGIILVMTHGIEIISLCVIRKLHRLRDNDSAIQLPKKIIRELIEQF